MFKRLEISAVGKLLLGMRPLQEIAIAIKNNISPNQHDSMPVITQTERARRQKSKNTFNQRTCAETPDYAELFVRHDGHISSKWGHYCFIYQELFARFLEKKQPLTLLEIGVQNGGSLQLWQKFLPEGSQIYGLDVDAKCLELKFARNIHVYHGNAASGSFWESNLQNITFDVIIDDGSHFCDEVTAAFSLLFDKKLKPGGLYLIEDLHTSYSWSYRGGFRKKDSSIEYCKNIIDAINASHFEQPVFFNQAEFARMRVLNQLIKKISFYDSVCAIEKYETERTNPFEIFLTGFDAGVYIDNKFESRKIENNIDKINKIKEYFTHK